MSSGADIPFTSGSGSKKRPVLVLWLHGQDAVVAAATSTVRLSRLDCLEQALLLHELRYDLGRGCHAGEGGLVRARQGSLLRQAIRGCQRRQWPGDGRHPPSFGRNLWSDKTAFDPGLDSRAAVINITEWF